MWTDWLELWKFHWAALLFGCVLDWILGDPYSFPHPVRLMGSMIAGLERGLRGRLKGRERLAGFLLVLVMCLSWGLLPWLALEGVRYFTMPGLWFIPLALETVICYEMLAAKSLQRESMKVCRSLELGDREGARKNVSMIVGRDTGVLDEEGIARAAVETVAENASDGVVAPFLFMMALGPAGGTFYKAVNTMDSMIGYKNENYMEFGRTAARLDDFLNFIPARITGCLMIATAFILPGMDGGKSLRIFLRDRKKHESPNAAHGEAACAGALGLRLAGDAWYFGELHKKAFIGDREREIEPEDIRRANRLMLGTEVMLAAILAVMACI
ncbi:MAG: adenosylcobinamide-phosphate synthase CbiB [Clostridium sp.]|nr:adenosylcobinamide-phosphate synthase CbiB [Clostridium sp.]